MNWQKLTKDDMMSNNSDDNSCNDIETGNTKDVDFGLAGDLQIQDSTTGATKKISNMCAICLAEYESGEKMLTIRDLLGHSSIQTT